MSNFWRKLRFLMRRSQFDRELEEEIRLHLEMKKEAGGGTDEARYAARRQFGNAMLLRENSREIWGWGSVETFVRDVAFGWRAMRRSPAVTATAVLSLALGIGANTAIFSLMDAVLLRILPVRDPSQLYFVQHVGDQGAGGSPPYPCFEQFRDRGHAFSEMAAVGGDRTKVVVDGQPEEVMLMYASGNLFSLLGVNAMVGRTLTAADDSVMTKGGPDGPVAVISYAYWRRRFLADPTVLGKAVHLGPMAATIVGVTPPEFFGLQPGFPVDVTVPMMLAGPGPLGGGSWWFDVIGRLKPGANPTQARTELDAIFQQFMSQSDTPAEVRKSFFDHIELTPAAKGLAELRRRFSKPLLVLMGIVALVLLIACTNVANLLVGRAASRRAEFAIRLALGAGKGRLARQLLTESFLLAGAGGLLGLVFAVWSEKALAGFFAVGRNPIVLDLHLDGRVLAFTAAISLFTAFAFGLAPAWHATRVAAGAAMKQESRSTRAMWPSSALVAFQVALSVVLLMGAGLFVRSLANLRNLDPGFRQDNILTMRLEPSETSLAGDRGPRLWEEILDRAARVPGVRSASLCQITPISGRYRGIGISVPGFVPRSAFDTDIGINHVSPAYFETLGIPVVAGRGFTERDGPGAPQVVLLNETAARFYFGGQNPVGMRMRMAPTPDGPLREIAGVVRDTKHQTLREPMERLMYLPIEQPIDPMRNLALVVRTQAEPRRMISGIQRAIREVSRSILITETTTLRAQVDQSLLEERLISTLSAAFGVLAVMLTCIGLYGVMSYAIVRRTREIGIRTALGAGRSSVLWLVLRNALLMVAIGLGVGIPAFTMGARYLETLLFGLKPVDPLTIVLAVMTMVLVAAIAAYVPAWRAAHIDPMEALRYE